MARYLPGHRAERQPTAADSFLGSSTDLPP